MEKIRIYCENTGAHLEVEMGKTLNSLAAEAFTVSDGAPVLSALVDNKLKALDYKIINPHNVRFLDYNHPDGRRTYIRSLCFVLQKVVREIFPDKVLAIDYSLPSGLYCEIRETVPLEDGRPKIYFLTDEEIMRVEARMKEIVAADLPFAKRMISAGEAERLFAENHQSEKVQLLRSLGRFNYNVYFLDGDADTFYGPLAPSTGCLRMFALMGFNDGFCLQYPMYGDPGRVLPMKRQSKLATALKKHSDWCSVMGVRGVGKLNEVVKSGKVVDLINLSEALHERMYADIADQIFARRGSVKIVFIAGPSSSGKTSTSKRVALQCRILGMNPKVIELDNYFVDRELTPRDEKGEYDFEALGAMDLDFLGKQLNELLEGKEVEIPRFDFKEGKRYFAGNFMQLHEKDILIMEGIHALNPAMIPGVDPSKVFRVYASALTSLSIDENNNISTSDNRMLRRMIRDNRTRGVVPEETIMRWASVRRGENRNIFPYQENADAVFNSAHIFELPVLKYYAEPLLRRISPSSPAFTEASRMLKFLDYIVALTPAEIAAIPPTSILREFIDGQTL
ncbi:MAG: nucleoside kinase [Bacteroidales bacterium]|nr:nucleoside kinase [Bacteroidales bacterium]MBQ9723392.1 nucleoside kinase [Bacteroidales bacterium]